MGSPTVILTVFLLVLGGCTGSADEDFSGSADSTEVTAPTTTLGPVAIVDVKQELALEAGQCWGPLPTPQPETTVPASLTVAVVECSGQNAGLAYGNGCLAANSPDDREPVQIIPCPGRPEDPWPGDRDIGRAAVSACLPLFEAGVGEQYASSSFEAIEMVPTMEQWLAGERRFVCTAVPGETP